MIYLSWLLPVPVLALIGVFMYRRKQHRLYQVFWAYIWFECARLISEAICYRFSWKTYFYAYWISAVCYVLFSLLLLRGIFATLVRLYSSTTGIRLALYEMVLLFFWLLGVLIASQRGGAHRPLEIIALVGQAVSVAEVGMFLFVVVSSAVLGFKWSELLCGIAAGLGLLGSADLLVFAALAEHRITRHTVSDIQTAAYFVAVLIFAFYFLRRPVENEVATSPNPELLRWTESMRRTVAR